MTVQIAIFEERYICIFEILAIKDTENIKEIIGQSGGGGGGVTAIGGYTAGVYGIPDA